jgi:hypothetical protein
MRRKPGNGARAADQPTAEGAVRAGEASAVPPSLPRRVRQASLAPQLRDEEAATPASDEAPPEPADGRSPDESRALVDALQFGWRRGLTDAALDDVWTPAKSKEQTEPADDPSETPATPPPASAGEGD